jgi:hypothetical protein
VRHFFLAHAAGDLPRVPLDARDDRVRVRALLGALVQLLDHHDLLPCLPALQQQRDFAGFVYCARTSVGVQRERARGHTFDHDCDDDGLFLMRIEMQACETCLVLPSLRFRLHFWQVVPTIPFKFIRVQNLKLNND